MKWYLILILLIQFAMWSTSEEPPEPMEGGPPPSQSSEVEPGVNLKESCEQSKSQLESLKDIMLRNKQSLRKKEEEIQVLFSILFSFSKINFLFLIFEKKFFYFLKFTFIYRLHNFFFYSVCSFIAIF